MRGVIFLDIDGVLCIAGCAAATFDPKCVAALNWLTDTADAQIVVSSTWRHMKNPTIDERLRRGGVTARVVGVTPDLSWRKVIVGGTTLWVGTTSGA